MTVRKISVLFLLLTIVSSVSAQTRYYAIEMQGKIIGYSEERVSSEEYRGVPVLAIRATNIIKMSLLGMPVDQRVETTILYDPEKRRPVFVSTDSETGPTRQRIETVFAESSAQCSVHLNGELVEEKEIELGPDVLRPWGNEFLVSLSRAFEDSLPGEKRSYKLFVHALQKVSAVSLGFKGEGEVRMKGETLAGRWYSFATDLPGATFDYFVAGEPERIIRVEYPDTGMTMYEAEAFITTALKRAEITDSIIAQTNEQIGDVTILTYMKVRADISAPGEEVTPATLNVPGQIFVGTVEGQRIRGVFEIMPPKYNGAGAPAFPPEFRDDATPTRYLSSEAGIESDHSEIVLLAREVTGEAPDAWQAAVALAEWVYRNIGGDIPGGGTALGTLRVKAAECAGHSRLHVALCRAVGIPARLATGAMYIPAYGGAFGQHVWSEVYMGEEVGWLAIDTTAGETSYVDAGHIRLGENVAFRPQEVTILDYEPKPDETLLRRPQPLPSPFIMGVDHAYRYLFRGEDIGKEVFRVEPKALADGEEGFLISAHLELTGHERRSTTIMTSRGGPLRYEVRGKAGETEYAIICERKDGTIAVETTKGEVTTEHTVNVPEDVLIFDNNALHHFAMMISRFDLGENDRCSLRAFHPSSLSVFPLEIRVGTREWITLDGTDYAGMPVVVSLAGQELTMFVTESGMLVRDEEMNGQLVMEYESAVE